MKLLDIKCSVCTLVILSLCACAHQSSIPLSNAHISIPAAAGETETAQETPVQQAPQAHHQSPHQAETSNNTVLSLAADAPVYSIVVYDTPVREVLFAMARDSKINMDIHPAIDGRITLNAVNQTLAGILTRISKQVNLRYQVENDVLVIGPDQPELRTYKIDYVNMSRDTTGFIGAAAEIASTGQSASTGVGGNSTITNTSGNGANNSSRTAVNSDSKNKFWETLERNVKDIHMNLCGRPIDFRVSTHPTIHGENIVLRVLDRQKSILPLQHMGIHETMLSALKSMLKRPEGMLIFTGPTGSGKTTTLYALLSELNSEGVNIMTLEDPVEYPLMRIRQTSVMEANKLDFSNGIRSMMRQDPDIILVGEIRDEATANMAFRAAMTGHQVFTTLHTNSALGVFPRLADIGILPAMMAGNIIGVVAQRLLRVLCPACKQPTAPDAQARKLLHLQADDTRQIYQACGCEQCANQGYRGRTVIMELLSIDDGMDALISRSAHLDELRSTAHRKGFTTLADDAARLVLNGTTSLDEAMRVIDLNRQIGS